MLFLHFCSKWHNHINFKKKQWLSSNFITYLFLFIFCLRYFLKDFLQSRRSWILNLISCNYCYTMFFCCLFLSIWLSLSSCLDIRLCAIVMSSVIGDLQYIVMFQLFVVSVKFSFFCLFYRLNVASTFSLSKDYFRLLYITLNRPRTSIQTTGQTPLYATPK